MAISLIGVRIRKELGDLLVPLGIYGSKPYRRETLLRAYFDFRKFKWCDPNLPIPDRFSLVYGRDFQHYKPNMAPHIRDLLSTVLKVFCASSFRGLCKMCPQL